MEFPLSSSGKRRRVEGDQPSPVSISSKSNSHVSSSATGSRGHQTQQSKRAKLGLLSESSSNGSSKDPTSTLHASSLNTPNQTVKGLYVDQQQRYLVEKRISKIQSKSGTVVTYQITAEASGEESKLQLKDMWYVCL